MMVNLLTVEEATKDVDRLGEATLTLLGWIEADRRRVVLGKGVPCTYPDLKTSVRESIQGRETLGQDPWVMEVVVQHQWAESDPFAPSRSERERFQN
jgi:hypothetical protein